VKVSEAKKCSVDIVRRDPYIKPPNIHRYPCPTPVVYLGMCQRHAIKALEESLRGMYKRPSPENKEAIEKLRQTIERLRQDPK